MHIKRIEAPTLNEALDRIRTELGPDALILETRNQSNGKRGVEVTAALPHAGAQSGTVTGTVTGSANASARPSTDAGNEAGSSTNVAGKVADILSRMPRATVEAALDPEQRRKVFSSSSYNGPIASPDNGIPALPTAATVGSPNVSSSPKTPVAQPPRELEEELRRSQDRLDYLSRLVRSEHFSAIPIPLRELYLDLTEAEIDSNLVFELVSRMGQAPLHGQFQSVPADELLERLRGLVQVGGHVEATDTRRIVALVGPTGVGKTTTVAKIAGEAAFVHRKKVALISTDSYRVFGAQHLGSYAALMGLPFEVAKSRQDIHELVDEALADQDLILIDTSGRSPGDPNGIREIADILGACPKAEIHLVLAANSRVRDMAFALASFGTLPVSHLIFTKTDETTRPGGLFTISLKARRPVAYLGTGQEVPDDLEKATPEKLTDGIVRNEEETVG